MKFRPSKLSELADVVLTPALPLPLGYLQVVVRKRPYETALTHLVNRNLWPLEVCRSVPSRQYEFVVGRLAAATLLMHLGAAESDWWVSSDHRRPVWPRGIVGCIAHTDALVAVVAGHEIGGAISVGLDIEKLDASQAALDALNLCFNDGERRLLSQLRYGLLLGFSAKESLFKCLSTEAARYFDFLDAEVTSIDQISQKLELRLLTTLSPKLPRLCRFHCSYMFFERHVWTLIVWDDVPLEIKE